MSGIVFKVREMSVIVVSRSGKCQVYVFSEETGCGNDRRRVSSVVEHSSTNPKVPGSIPGSVSCREFENRI